MDRWTEIWDEIISAVSGSVGDFLPNAAAAIAILIFGWILAAIFSRVIKSGLGRTPLNNWAGKIWKPVAGDTALAKPPPLNAWIGRFFFYLFMVIVVVAAFEVLGSAIVVDPINDTLNEVLAFLPSVAAAIALLFVAWVAASVVRAIIRQAVAASGFLRRFGAELEASGEAGTAVARLAGDVSFWLVFVLFLPAILSVLKLEGLLEPVQVMVTKVLAFLPNLVGAGIILVVGWLLAKVVRRLATNVAAAAGVDSLAEKAGVAAALGANRISALLGLIAYALVLIPAFILALEALELESVSQPSSQMLGDVLAAIPAIAAGAVVLVLAFIVGRILRDVVNNILEGAGVNSLPVRLGITAEPIQGNWRPSWVVGYAVMVALLLFATLQASEILGSVFFSELVASVIAVGGQVVVGLVALVVGIWIANVAARAITGMGGSNASLVAGLARWGIILFTIAVALKQIGIADEIIILAFGLPVAAVAIAVAVAFGVGGRQTAARELDGWLERRRGPASKSSKS